MVDGAEGGAEAAVDDEETLRPSEAFNPLLFRALQSVAASLPQPPPPPNLPQPPAATAPKEKSAEVPKMEVDEKENGAQEKSLNGIRISATGKRKPKKAA